MSVQFLPQISVDLIREALDREGTDAEKLDSIREIMAYCDKVIERRSGEQTT